MAIPVSPQKYAESALDIRIPKNTIILNDTYEEPSFPLGDGYSWTIFQIQPEREDELIKSIKASPDWKPLPLPPDFIEHEEHLQPNNIFGVEGSIPVTTAKGYYIFIDRQDDNVMPFYMRKSFNFTFGLYDQTDGKLYLYSIDT